MAGAEGNRAVSVLDNRHLLPVATGAGALLDAAVGLRGEDVAVNGLNRDVLAVTERLDLELLPVAAQGRARLQAAIRLRGDEDVVRGAADAEAHFLRCGKNVTPETMLVKGRSGSPVPPRPTIMPTRLLETRDSWTHCAFTRSRFHQLSNFRASHILHSKPERPPFPARHSPNTHRHTTGMPLSRLNSQGG